MHQLPDHRLRGCLCYCHCWTGFGAAMMQLKLCSHVRKLYSLEHLGPVAWDGTDI